MADQESLNIENVTNSVMGAIDKELRKCGIAPEFHSHYRGNRQLIKGMIAMMVTKSDTEKCDNA